MAGYIRDPEYIRALVQREYGAHRAPPVDTIKQMQADHRYLRDKFRDQYGDAPANDDLLEWRPASLIKQPKPRRVVAVRPPVHPAPKPERIQAIELLPGKRIIQDTAAAFDMTVAELTGTRRHRRFVYARAVANKLLRDLKWSDGTQRLSYPQIARMMGGRDHSTVIHSIEHFDLYCRLEPKVREVYDTLREAL